MVIHVLPEGTVIQGEGSSGCGEGCPCKDGGTSNS